jgi:hypothetical protein
MNLAVARERQVFSSPAETRQLSRITLFDGLSVA